MKMNNRFLVAMVASTALTRMPTTFEDFAFPDTVDDINTVPERARGLYTEKDGKYTFTDVGGLRSALNSTRAERDAAARRAKDASAYAALGKTPEEIKELLDAQAAAEEQKAKDAGEWDNLKSQMETNHAKALGDKDKAIGKIRGALEHSMIDSKLLSALADKDVEGNPLFLLPALRGRMKLEETDDGFRPVVLTEDGSPMLNGQNQPATPKDLVLEFKGKEDWAGAFKGLNQSGGGGTGSGNGGGGGGGTGTKKRSEMSPPEKVAYIKEHGKSEYDKLPA